MTTNPPDSDELDDLLTEAVVDPELMLDELGVMELVGLMNERDATIAGSVRAALPEIGAALEATVERMRRGGRLIYVGAGTSGRLGVLDASEVPPTFGVDDGLVIGLIAGGSRALISSIEAAEDDPDAGARDLDALAPTPLDTVIGIASSGRTPYVIGALQRAAQRGALTVGVSCNRATPVSAVADHRIEILVGSEIVAGSTRLGAGTATKMVLNMFSTISMIKLGKTYRTLMVDVKATNAKLVRRAIRIVGYVTGVDEDTAEAALERTGWHAKDAIAMIITGMDAEQVRAALTSADGSLGKVIGH